MLVTKPVSGIWAEKPALEPYGISLSDEFKGQSGLLDQYGVNDYKSGPQDFVHEANRTLPNGVTNTGRLQSTEQQQLTWSERFYDFVYRTTKNFGSALGPVGQVGQLYTGAKDAPKAIAKVKSTAKSFLWKAAFVLIAIFVGYFFFKTVAVKYAGKV